jgi:ribonucleoside-diphosphate reductase beta chain
MNLLTKSVAYKPFKYPWAYEFYKKQTQNHWTADEINYSDDIKDWNEKLTEQEKHFLTQIFRFFTQVDVDVASGYCDHFIPYFKNNEIRMALLTNAQMEVCHQDAYSKILETLHLPETEYSVFLEYSAMRDKNDFFENFNTSSKLETALAVALYGAFSEGLQLFSSFVMLLSFQRFNKMKSMCEVVAYSIRDERIHTEFMIELFHQFVKECSESGDFTNSDIQLLGKRIEQTCKKVIEMEDSFIDLTFSNYTIEGLSSHEVKRYIRFIANLRMEQLGYPKLYSDCLNNPLTWVDELVSGVEFTNFFEGKPTAYTKGATRGTWDDVFN